jgi:hypothetical protein
MIINHLTYQENRHGMLTTEIPIQLMFLRIIHDNRSIDARTLSLKYLQSIPALCLRNNIIGTA